MKGELIFNEETHTYTLDGKVLPSVTKILAPLVDFSKVPADLLERAKNFGTNSHLTIKLYHGGILDEECLDPHLQGILKGFCRWLKGSGYRLSDFICEKPLASRKLCYAGTPDLIADGRAVIDIKTRLFKKTTDPLQCSAYEKLHLENGGSKGKYEHGILYLKDDGSYLYTKANDRDAWGMFRTLLDYHNMAQTIEAWRKRK